MEPESLQLAGPIAPGPARLGGQFAVALAGTVAVALGDVYDSLQDAWPDIIHATRSWIQYGTVGFAVLCIAIGAVEALLGK